MTKEEIEHLQGLLNKIGGLLETDGLSGRNTRRAIADARALAELPVGEESDLDLLQAKIRTHIRLKVEADVQAVLDLDKRTITDLLDTVFADEKTWAGIMTFAYSLFTGGTLLTAGSAIYTLGNLGSKAFRVARDRREKLKASQYVLLYRMKGL